ncbi:MAG TPA: sulfatase, partial [Thermoanaerobaculia bacterium]|nr:sulfatase [Thermoanaerobaculia bacterium]
ELRRGHRREVVGVGRVAGGGWADLVADLSRYAGEEVELSLEPALIGLPPPTARLAWSPLGLTSSPSGRPSRPNVLFILVDTLRADHLTPYGYSRETSPEIARLLAARGVLAEKAYSQAPWTIPSVISFMTGRYPGELLQGPMESYSMPEGVETLAERFQALGYRTAAFFGNYVLRDPIGMGRGFETRWVPAATPDSNYLHADAVNGRALPWLAAHQEEPFFLYVHYMDPHDPYDSPELKDGRSPFYPDYDGRFLGTWVHGLYTGNLKLDDPVKDLAQLTALYDSEVHTVDRAVGELLAALEPEVAANTLIVLTADHGEELFDHGGFKHGQTLFEEQIHVPLIFRWDAGLPAGKRLGGDVQLVDLLPTLVAAAGGQGRPEWRGINLLPALAGREALPRRPVFAQHLATGPLRAAVILGGKKLFWFNRAEPFAPINSLVEHLWKLDLERLPRRALYDLAADPGERHNRIEEPGPAAGALTELLDGFLDGALPGLKVMASGLAPGEVLQVALSFDRPPGELHPYFLSERDGFSLSGKELRLTLVGEPAGSGQAEKGVWLPVEGLGLESVTARRGGIELSGSEILLGAGQAYAGSKVESSGLVAGARPLLPPGPRLRIWARPAGARGAGAAEVDQEVQKVLKALGYVQ